MSTGAEVRQLNPGLRPVRPAYSGEMTAFARNVSQLLEHVEYRRCESGEDLEDIYRLRYESYHAAGLIEDSFDRRIVDEFDNTPNSYTFGVYYDGYLVSTIRLHHITAESPVGPSMKIFGDVLQPRLDRGESFVDPSRFAGDPDWSNALKVVPYLTLRLAQVACRYFEPSACLTTVREEHVAFYKRILYAEEVMGARQYPGLTVSGHLYQSVYPEACDKVAERFPFFESTPLEQRMLFERREGQLARLTVLPSAKYLLRAA
jgi:hypothetical protein